jgi:hypothetical protein
MMPDTCIKCNSHEIISDPDPFDWFCDDDVAVVCKKVKNPKRDLKSKYTASKSEFRAVVVGCRPYKLEKEAIIPQWCPDRAPSTQKT